MTSGSSLPTPFSWGVNKDGWLVRTGGENRLLLWIPSDIRSILLPPLTILSISTDKSVGLNLSNGRVGELWVDCYQPY